jgi:competence protein ComEA
VTWANTDTSSYKVRKATTYRSPVKRYQSAKRIIVELNSCDSASLDALPGIGPILAKRIIRYRNLLGGYSSPDQLREVYGLSDSTYMLVRGRVKADSGLIRKIRVNGADYKGLSRLPYFEKTDVIAILNFRALKGNIGSIDELVLNQIITSVKAEKVKPYLDFGK